MYIVHYLHPLYQTISPPQAKVRTLAQANFPMGGRLSGAAVPAQGKPRAALRLFTTRYLHIKKPNCK